MSDLSNSSSLGLLLNPQSPPSDSLPSPDPTLLLSSPGVSSTSRDGTSLSSISQAQNPDSPPLIFALRQKAADMLGSAADVDRETENSSAPTLQHQRVSPLETAIGLALGGALNSISPYSSEGSQGLKAFLNAQANGSDLDFQNEVQQHSAAIAAAREGYRLASDQAQSLLDQANGASQQMDGSTRLQTEQDRQETLRSEAENSRVQEDQLSAMHHDFAGRENATAEQAPQQQKLLQSKLVDVLAQTGPGRAILAAHAGLSLQMPPEDVVKLARIATQSRPVTVAKSLKSHPVFAPSFGSLPPAQ